MIAGSPAPARRSPGEQANRSLPAVMEVGAGQDGTLDAALLAAHAAGDEPALVRLYTAAGDVAETAGHVDAACFYLTHAYVFALSAGAPQAEALHARLASHGREE